MEKSNLNSMSKERYNQIIDEVYEYFITKTRGLNLDLAINSELVVIEGPVYNATSRLLTQEEFIHKCKTDKEFSEKWGLKIEEQMLTEERRYNIWFNNNYETGMERFFNPEQLPDYDNPYYQPTPTKEITISYNGETIKVYE
jgi:hypothetical protein